MKNFNIKNKDNKIPQGRRREYFSQIDTQNLVNFHWLLIFSLIVSISSQFDSNIL